MLLNLTDEARDVLHSALESYLAELRIEVARTDNKEFRAQLCQRRDVLEFILAELERIPLSA